MSPRTTARTTPPSAGGHPLPATDEWAAVAPERCADCDATLHRGEDVRCRWCDDNRARHPEDYDIPDAVRALAG